MFTAYHHATKSHYEAQAIHAIHTGHVLKVRKGIVARARTPGGIYRQLFAQYRQELSSQVMTERALTISHE